jgi:hypothetical protein
MLDALLSAKGVRGLEVEGAQKHGGCIVYIPYPITHPSGPQKKLKSMRGNKY